MKYQIFINQGNEYFGTEGKTITVGEVHDNKEEKTLTTSIFDKNRLIPIQVIDDTMENFIQVIIEAAYDSKVVQLKDGNDVVARFYADINIKGGNINLARAQELIPGTTEITEENAAELVQKAGLEIRIRADVMPRFTEKLKDMKPKLNNVGVVTRDRIVRSDSSSNVIDTSTGTTVDTSTGSNPGGDDIPTGNG